MLPVKRIQEAGRQLRAGRRRRCLGAALLSVAAAGVSARVFIAPTDAAAVRPQREARELLALGFGPLLLGAAPAEAAEGEASQLPFFIGGLLVALAGAGALALSGETYEQVDDKKVVREYFNTEGFERWQKIYGETEDVNPVQKDIRVGHAQTVDKILTWLDPNTISGKTVCDAGCGTGSLSIPLASRGAVVNGSDISSAMVGEAEVRAKASLSNGQLPKFSTSDLEAIAGEYDTVCCVDVLIHYPPEKMAGMVQHLAGLSKERLILSFAPKTWYYKLLKRVGELFPGKSKTTRAYLHDEADVEAALLEAGYQVTRKDMTATNFYFSRLFEAKPVAS